MVTILLIADNPRLERLFDFTKDYPQIDLRISRSLRQGIQDIGERPPALLFIQNHLSGLSGEIIVRHLLAGAEGTPPQVALFGETGGSSADALAAYLDLSLSDEELTAAVIRIITASETGVDAPPPLLPATPAVASAATENGATGQPTPPPDESRPESPGDQSEPAGIASVTTLPAAEEGPSLPSPADSMFDRQLQSALEQAPQPVPLAAIEEHLAEETIAAPLAEAGNAPAGHQERHAVASVVRRASIVGVLAVAGIILFFVVSPHKPSPPTPAKRPVTKPRPSVPTTLNGIAGVKQVPPPAVAPSPRPAAPVAAAPPTPPASGGLTKLPAFIPRQPPDKAYAANHPGWERYRGVRTEFRVYRSNEMIKAVQAIDRSGRGIPESFMRGSLRQMTGSERIAVSDRQQQGAFSIEKGTTVSGARVVVYRKGGSHGAIRAFVVYFQ